MNTTTITSQNISQTFTGQSVPALAEYRFSSILEKQMKSFETTGYTIILNLPVAKNSKQPLFVVSTLGFIPPYIMTDKNNAWNLAQVNESLVQPLPNSLDIVKINTLQKYPTAQYFYDNFRYVAGSPSFAFRISSNTAVSGNLQFTTVSAVQKKVYLPSEKYYGCQSYNMPFNNADYDQNSFILGDLSLVRTVKAEPINTKPNRFYDMHMINYRNTIALSEETSEDKNAISSYHLRDFIVVGALGNLSSLTGDATQISIEVFADWSNVQFAQPTFPLIRTIPYSLNKQILKFSETFVNKIITNCKKPNAEWLPGEE